MKRTEVDTESMRKPAQLADKPVVNDPHLGKDTVPARERIPEELCQGRMKEFCKWAERGRRENRGSRNG